MRKSSLLLAALIILLSSLFRLTNLDLIEFKADEAINLFLSSRPIFDHSFPPGGTVSSLGVLNFPLMNYILFPIILLSTDPRLIAFFIGLINSLAIGILFLIFNRYYGTRVALITSSLLALSPWAILFSRKIWAQDLIIPLSIPLIFSIHKIIFDREDKYWILYAISSLLLVQIYHSALFFLVPLSFFLFLKIKPNLKYLLFGIIIGFIPAFPYFIYQLTNGCPDCTTFLAVRERLNPSYFPTIFIRPFQIMGRGNIQTIIGQDMVTFLRDFPLAFHAQKIFYLEYLLLPAGLILFWKKFKKLRLLIISIILLPVLYFIFRIEPFIHYFIITLPFLFLFVAFSIHWLLSQRRILFRSVGAASFILLLGASALFSYSLFELIKKGEGLVGDYGTSYIKSKRTHEAIFKMYRSDPHYQEMLIMSYIPKSLLHGDIGIAKMLFSKESVEREVFYIENRLKEVPEDPRMHAKLIYYYTRTVPTKQTLLKIETKARTIRGYQPVYEEVERFFSGQK